MLNGNGGGDAALPAHRKGFLTRLARDVRGNTLAIVGAALVPLAGMIGSGVDMSRAYMAKTRLQSACDAAALAGRRVMTDDTLSATVTNEAVRFFNFNFRQNLYQTESFTPVVTRPSSGTVRVTASTRIPTSIMRIFGFTTLPLNVTCDASLNFVNTDVTLVLDVTGSMADNLNGTQKIVALRDAVMALYDQLAPVQTQLESNGLRLRYAVVPYSSTVNVGALIRGANPAYLADNVEFQTRVPRYDTLTYVADPGTPGAPVVEIYGSAITQSDCDLYGQNVAFPSFSPSPTSGGGPAPNPSWSRVYSNNEASGVDWGWSGAPDTNSNKRSCRRRYVQTPETWETRYRWTSTSYEAESVNVSAYKMGNSVDVANTLDSRSSDGNDANDGYVTTPGVYDALELAQSGHNIAESNVTWNGCIEERQTSNPTLITPTTPSNLAIPATAYDLDINLIPNSDETRWRPMFPAIEYSRTAGTTTATTGSSLSSAACPAAAVRLQAWTRGNMQSYVNALVPTGSTYHDIGMLWGARLLSSGGIFADSPDTFASMPVARHIIFMTDGQMDTDPGIYGSYGIEKNDQRISGMSFPSETELNGRHLQRFRMICNAAKSLNISIWVIAFGTTLTTDMTNCASNANQAATISNRDALIAKFREIGNNIGALRLTQ
ncbi:MAG TPA: TadE/TadG family type IV pilus assembly protein [Allosphingosinicella sp.]|nr:TadE/TadG family type IV pilus assembly protein [Allosphingosinicella sp.]